MKSNGHNFVHKKDTVYSILVKTVNFDM